MAAVAQIYARRRRRRWRSSRASSTRSRSARGWRATPSTSRSASWTSGAQSCFSGRHILSYRLPRLSWLTARRLRLVPLLLFPPQEEPDFSAETRLCCARPARPLPTDDHTTPQPLLITRPALDVRSFRSGLTTTRDRRGRSPSTLRLGGSTPRSPSRRRPPSGGATCRARCFLCCPLPRAWPLTDPRAKSR